SSCGQAILQAFTDVQQSLGHWSIAGVGQKSSEVSFWSTGTPVSPFVWSSNSTFFSSGAKSNARTPGVAGSESTGAKMVILYSVSATSRLVGSFSSWRKTISRKAGSYAAAMMIPFVQSSGVFTEAVSDWMQAACRLADAGSKNRGKLMRMLVSA